MSVPTVIELSTQLIVHPPPETLEPYTIYYVSDPSGDLTKSYTMVTGADGAVKVKLTNPVVA